MKQKSAFSILYQYTAWPEIRRFEPYVPGTPVRGMLLKPGSSWFANQTGIHEGWVIDTTGLLLTDEVELVCSDGKGHRFVLYILYQWIEWGSLKLVRKE